MLCPCGSLVVDFHKIKAASRRYRTAGVAVARFKGLLEITLLPTALPHELQRTNHRAHLVVQKGPRGGLDANDLAMALSFSLARA